MPQKKATASTVFVSFEKAWIAKGLTNGPMVCRYASRGFRRLIARRVEKKVEAAEQVAVNLKRRKTR